MKVTWYKKETDTLYINTDSIMPEGGKIKERMRCMELPYSERIEKFASEEEKKEIYEQLEAHKGCTISEFMNI